MIGKNKLALLLMLMLLSQAGKAQYAGSRMVTERSYPNCIELSNDSVRVVLEPNLGGRVLAYELKGKNVLYVDDSQDGAVYVPGKYIHPSGGRSDIGPERTIPAHPALFLGRWNAKITGEREAELTSQKDTATGIQLIRQFKLAKSGSLLEFTQIIKNIGKTSKSYCHWSRTFVKGMGISLSPLNPESRYPAGYLIYGPGKILNFMPENEPNIRTTDGILEITGVPSQPKIVTDGLAGWLAYLTNDNQLFIKKYPVFPHRNYGEIAASTACIFYKELMCEIEPIGPMETIAPERMVSFKEQWFLFNYPFPHDKKVDLKGIQNLIEKLK